MLTQIIFDEENKGQNLLPIRFLRQLIRFYGDSMQAFIPSYLEFSLESLTREQERFRQQMMESFGGEPFRAMEEQARRNVAMFQQAVQMFNPFAMPPATNPVDAATPAAAAGTGPSERRLAPGGHPRPQGRAEGGAAPARAARGHPQGLTPPFASLSLAHDKKSCP